VDPWIPKATVILATIVMIAIRAPHGQRSRGVRVVTSRKGPLENSLLVLASLGFCLPLVWVATPWLASADYPSSPIAFGAGVALLAGGLWLFHRSHADLGTNWSITLELRENHSLVSQGVYGRVRHPMYLALLLHSLGQALVLPNWIAGPAYLVTFGLLFALRVGPEERMMREQFGPDYAVYAERTKRLVPGVW